MQYTRYKVWKTFIRNILQNSSLQIYDLIHFCASQLDFDRFERYTPRREKKREKVDCVNAIIKTRNFIKPFCLLRGINKF